MDGFSAQRAYSLIPLLALFAGYYFLLKTGVNQTALAGGYFGLLIAYVAIRAVWNQRRMKALGMPDTYRRHFTIAQAMSMLGIAWFVFTMLYPP